MAHKNMFALVQGGPGEEILNIFLAQTLSLPVHEKARFSSLSSLIRYLPTLFSIITI